ncbi:hypothetical protein F441_05822 [Phytophthora nicotianae CJ01A1]|uniref:Uncharacterized protein n=5 Tax=Phytophthora nicotianae TaxID=4792 RepID=W2QGZ8_PHYN3|nr:hypothetical protein PPTG_22594 [Phytophthora nicotianae INRA-310]ETI50683.1 hypothetical protein F443_05818 [Phytophthora nicotianae P1569]ETO79417.1 hypothetical protein F444_05866 [Phytophthora nicotianae P1976]ETP20457.1 hypothetical protein F441_05822 [Phytophthora nicotianae CJ01A1]ETP48350.1 hypothetical protein F442_05862 [Phytophthora nicotianae P10297]ETN11560.1 hypothetical protein PPTG_22594 [Phytophthora nicotianae INRA-310]
MPNSGAADVRKAATGLFFEAGGVPGFTEVMDEGSGDISMGICNGKEEENLCFVTLEDTEKIPLRADWLRRHAR